MLTREDAYLEDSLLNRDANALAIHAGPGVANETELEVDADLLARALGELLESASTQRFQTGQGV